MALRASELLLIVRAQNQASGALRRVAGDMAGLSKIRDLHFRQNQLAINQATTMRQRERALNEMRSIEERQGAKNLSLQRRRLSARATEIGAIQRLKDAEYAVSRAREQGLRPTFKMLRAVERHSVSLQAARKNLEAVGAGSVAAAERANILDQEIKTANARLAQNAFQQREVAKAIRQQKWERLQAGGRIMTHLGRVMQLAGLVSGAALAYMASSAAKFNSEATLVATQTGKIGSGAPTVARNSKIISAALLGVMAQSTATREELTQAAYDIYSSLNVSLGGGMRLLRMFSKASIAGMTPLPDVTHAAITVMNDFGLRSLPQVHAALNRMFAAVRFGRMNFQQFVGMISTTAPAFKAAGQSFDSMTGAMAFMTRMIPNTRMAGTALARLTEILGRKDFVQGAKEFGVNITDIHGRLLPMITVMDKLVARFPKLRQGGTFLQNFIKMITAGKDEKGGLQGTIQARRALTFMVQHLQLYHQIQRQVTTDQNEFARSFSAMRKTAGVQWGVFVNRLKAFALVIGAAVIPALLKLSQPLQRLVNWFTKLDSAHKAQIGKWATYAAALLLFGGTVISVGGMLITFLAILGRFGIAGTGIAAIFIGIIAAVKILRGEWSSLNDVVTSFADTMTGSFKGFLAMSALVVVAALRIRKAFLGLAAAQIGTAGVAGSTGMLAGIGGAVGTGRAVYQTNRALAQASRLKALMLGTGAAAAAIPGSLLVAGTAIAGAAAAAGLWELHMRGVRKDAEEAARHSQQLQQLAGRPGRAAVQLGTLGGGIRGVLAQKNAVAELNAQIKELRNQVKQAAAADKPGLQRQLTDLIIQRADATDELTRRNYQANRSFNQMSQFVRTQAQLLQAVAQAHQRVVHAQQENNKYTTEGGLRNQVFVDRLKAAKNELDLLSIAANRNAIKIRSSFTRVVRDAQKVELLPGRIKPGAIDAALRVSLRRGRMLTLPEMRIVFRAFVNKADLRKAPKDIQAAIKETRIQIKTDARSKRQVQQAFKPIFQALHVKDQNSGKVHSKVAKVFAKTINQRIHIGPVSPSAASVGANIALGIASGVTANSGAINAAVAAAVSSAVAAGQAAAKSKSPSQVTRDKIGIPLMQGIITGIELMYGQLERSSRLAIEFFNGPWLSSETFTNRTAGTKKQIAELTNRIHALRKAAKGTTPQILALQERLQQLRHPGRATTRDLIRDMMATLQTFRMFNNAMERLQRRGVPLLLLDQLSQLGAEGAQKIAMLARMTDRQLRLYVRLWRAAMAEVRRSTRTVMDQITSDLQQKTEDAAHFLLDMYNNIHDQITSVVGDLSSTFSDAAQASKDWADTVRNHFGELFQGAYATSQEFQTLLDWGHILNISDLLKDLQSQLDAFNAWSNDLTTLASKVPAELFSYLSGLGPEGAAIIHALATATGPELANYVKLWQQAQDKIKKFTIKDFGVFGRGTTPEAAMQDMIARIGRFWTVMESLKKKGVYPLLLAQIMAMGPEGLDFAEALDKMPAVDLKRYLANWNFVQGAIAAMTKEFMQGQIDEWRKHGSNIAIGIITGIMDQQEALLKFFRNLFKELLKEAKKETKSKSPSMVFRTLGEDIMSGLQLGLDSGATVPYPRLGRGFTRGQGFGVGQPPPIHMEVHAHHDESLMTTIERASFRLRNRLV